MLDRLKNLFANVEPSKAEPSFDLAHMAAAVLLAYAAQVDGSLDQHEETVLKRITGPAFGLSEDEAASLIALASTNAETANDLFQWTNIINSQFEYDHKLHLMELLWQVVDADGIVDDYEANLMRRIAGLIHVSDKDSAIARQNARKTNA